MADICVRFVSNLEIRDRFQCRYVCGQTDMTEITGAYGDYANTPTHHAGLKLKLDRTLTLPVPVAVRSKAWVCGRSFVGIVRSNPAGGMDVCLL